jgi:small-conductance mechanosensitive channel
MQGTEGKVVKITVRTTVIETKEGRWVYIPNALFMSNLLTRRTKTKPEFTNHENASVA